jgi:glycosyltransferase involved in cell wall biosynthesis
MSFVEIVSNPDRLALAALYRRCRVFMLASHEEGFGIVLIEAMASGAPVVSTDCGGPRAIVEEGKNGFLVPVGDSAVLAERVVRLLRDNLLRETMGRCAQSRAQTTFSLEVCGRRFAAVYRKAMEARVHPAG